MNINKNTDPKQTEFHDPLDGLASGGYSHLKVFQSRKNDDHRLPQLFLYVDPVSFGRVSVNKVWLSDNNIIIEVQEISTATTKEIIVDVNSRPDFIMVRWDDIVKMVMSEYRSSITDKDLLEFCF